MGSYKAAKEMYPILNKYDYKIVDTPNEDSPYYLEHFPPGEVGSLEMPRPKGIPLEEYGLQIFKDVRPEDIAGDIISHHIVNKDKYLSEKYKDFKTSTSLDIMKERYKYHKENFNEQRDFNSWSERTGYPELFRGYVFNQFDEETKNNLYSPKQKTVLNEIKEYITKKPKDFAQGGLTMNNQTQMAFALGGEAETRDPVSGNDVPPGSLPVEVRDDIPARLSEGEYVVPADVVRFFGVKFFEDIRMQAKKGLQQMDRDGRIGGEPVDDQMISDQDLAQLEGMLSQQGMAGGGLAQGGMMDKLLNAVRTNPVVNERMKAAGIPIEMAVGGSVGIGIPSNSQNVDPRKVDEVIAKIGAAAQQNPELMRMLGERGINVPRTTATQTPEQMQQANSPAATTNPIMNEKPVAANAGGLMGYQEGGTAGYMAANPTGTFDPTKYTTVGGTLFDPNTYTPGSSVPIPEAAPAATEPAGGCGLGMMWNGQMCVIDPDYRAVKFNDDDNEPPIETDKVEQKPWYEQDPNFFGDPKKFIADQIGRGEFGDEAQLGMALSPVAGVVAAFANKLEDGNGVAKARAAFAIHQALGTEGFEEGGEYSNTMTTKLATAGYDNIGTGKMYKDRFAKDYGFDNFEEASSKSTEFSSKYKPKDGKKSTAIGGGIYGLTNRERFARKHKNRVKYAKLRKEGKILDLKIQNPDGTYKAGDAGLAKAATMYEPTEAEIAAARKKGQNYDGSKIAKTQSQKTKAERDIDIAKSKAAGKAPKGTVVDPKTGETRYSGSGKNKGGLITKRKKK